MSFNLKEVLVSAVLPALESIVSAELSTAFQSVQQHNTPEMYANTLKGLHSGLVLLKTEVAKTKSRIDDGVIDMLISSIEDAASEANITL